MLGEHPARQAFDVEILGPNPGKSVDEFATFLMQMIAAQRRDVCVIFCKDDLTSSPALRTALASGERALAPPQAFLRPLRPSRSLDLFPVRERHKSSKAEVNADRIGVGVCSGCRNLDVEHDVPLAVLPGEDCRCRLTRQRTVPADLDLARHADETQAPALADRKAVADAHLSSVIASLGAETREAILTALDAAEERLECPIETPQDLLLGAERPAREVGAFSAHGAQLGGLHAVIERDAAPLIGFDALLKSGVVEVAEIRQHRGKRGTLRPVRR